MSDNIENLLKIKNIDENMKKKLNILDEKISSLEKFIVKDNNFIWKLDANVNFNEVKGLIIEIDEYLNNMKNDSKIIGENFFQTYIDYLKDIMEDLLYNEELKKKTKDKSKFPSIYDNEFNKKIYENNEFNRYKYEPNNHKNSKFFKKFTYQKFLRRFMAKDTPYNGLLIYHGVGVGKSCSAISIAEEFKEIYNYNKNNIYLITPNKQLQQNFKKEIFNIDKEENKGLLQNVQCTGNNYIKMYEKYKKINLDEKKKKGKEIEKKMDMLINDYYNFLTLGDRIPEYYINEKSKKKNVVNIIKSNTEFNEKIKNIKRDFSNKIIICDEIHEYRVDEEEIKKDEKSNKQIKKISQLLKNIARYAVNTKIVLLSATPIFNNYTEIEFILNLLLVNDNRAPIQTSEIFNRDGQISEKFKRKLNGYISYVRGDDPIKFPLKIYPELSSSYSIPIDKFNDENNDKNSLNKRIWEIIGVKNDEEKLKKLNDLKKIFDSNKNSRQKLLFYKNELDVQLDQGKNYCNANSKEKKNKILYIYESKECIKKMNQKKNDDEKLKILKNHSIKFYNIINNLKKKNSEGITFIYSRFVEDSIEKLKEILKCFGYHHLKKPSENLKKDGMNFVVLQGNDSKNIVPYINLINGNDNKNGDKIKIILGTPAIDRGYSFFNVRSVHILEPWFNLSRINQIIGRATRSFSHKQLEDSKQNVTIYLHSTILTGGKDQPLTIDEERWIYSFLKKLQTIKIEQVLKEKSIDCLLNKKINQFTDKNYPKKDYEFLYERTVIDHMNIEIQNVNYLDQDYNELCNFTKCEFQCNNEQNIDKELKDQHINKHLETLIINKIIKILLKNIFENKLIYKLNEISNDIKELRKYKIKIDYTDNEWLKLLKFALNKMIKDKRVVNSYQGVKGRIIKKENEYYVFQPNYLKNIHLPLYSRYIENADYDNIENIVDNDKNREVKEKKIDKKNILQQETNMDNYIDELNQYLKYVKVYWLIGLLKKEKNITRPYIYIHDELLKINDNVEDEKKIRMVNVLKEANLTQYRMVDDYTNPVNQGILSTLILDIINFRENISNNILLNVNYGQKNLTRDDFIDKINIIEHTRINNGINDEHVGHIISNILKNEEKNENIITDIEFKYSPGHKPNIEEYRIIKDEIENIFPYHIDENEILKLNDNINFIDDNKHSKIIWYNEDENKWDYKNKYILNEKLQQLQKENKSKINISEEIVKKIDNKLISIYFLRFFEFNNSTEKILDLLRYFYFKCFNNVDFENKYKYLKEIFDNYYNNNKKDENLNLINEIDGKKYFISSNIFYKIHEIKGKKVWDYNFDEIFKLFKIELNEKSPSFTGIDENQLSSLIQKSFKVYLIHEKEKSINNPILYFNPENEFVPDKPDWVPDTPEWVIGANEKEKLLSCIKNKVEFIKKIYFFNKPDKFGEFNKEIFAFTLDKYSGNKYGPVLNNKGGINKKDLKLIEENQIIVGQTSDGVKYSSINLNILKENNWPTKDIYWKNWYKNNNLQHLPGSFYSKESNRRSAEYDVNSISYGLGVFLPENYLVFQEQDIKKDIKNNNNQIKRPIIMNKSNMSNLTNNSYLNFQKKFRYCRGNVYFHSNTRSPVFLNLVLYLIKKIINKNDDNDENLNFLNENNFIMFNNGYITLEAHIETNCYIKYFWNEKIENKQNRKCINADVPTKPRKGFYASYLNNKNDVRKPFGNQDDLNQFIEILCRYLNLENGNELNFFMRKDIAELCSYNLFLNNLIKKK